MTQSARAFQTIPDMDSGHVRIRPRSPNGKDFGGDLLRARGRNLELIAKAADTTKTFKYEQIQSDERKWSEFVSNINLELLKPDSPFCTMPAEDALALLLTLEAAGNKCGANLNGREFAALVLNLPQLAQLSFTPQDKLQIGAFARAVVDAAAGIMPANGMDFVNMPEEDRRSLLRALVDKSLRCLEAAGLGLADGDEQAFRSVDLTDVETSLFGGGLRIIRGDRQGDEAEVMLSPHLLLPTKELTERLEELAGKSGGSTGEMANRLMVSLISTVAHELYHASQYSQISGPDIDKHSEYLRAQTNKFSLAVERQHSKLSQDPAKRFVLFHHEQGAWYTSHMVRAAIAESSHVDRGLRDAADAMLADPRDFLMLEVLVGKKPPAFAIVEFGGISSAESGDKLEDIMRATAALGRAELNRVAPLRQGAAPATSAIKV
jgi:hypothetical protein